MASIDRMRRVWYALIGACVAQGAGLGLLGLRLLRGRSFSLRRVASELAADPETFLYVATSTTVMFAAFGALFGRYADRLAQLAETDALTALPNLRAFQHRFHDEMIHASRYAEPIAVLVIDVDDMKAINDGRGHAGGDRALRLVAGAIRRGLRQADMGGRIGGDEFAVLAPNTDGEAALVLAERLRSLVAKGQGDDPHPTISVGVAAVVPSNHETVTQFTLTRAADAAVYEAKRRGGNRVALAAEPAAQHQEVARWLTARRTGTRSRRRAKTLSRD